MKVLILKIDYNTYSDYDSNQLVYPSSMWEEISEEKYVELSGAVQNANANLRRTRKSYSYALLVHQEIEYALPDIMKNADEFIKVVRKEQEKEEKRKEAYNKKKEETALKRKQKQLEKLKKELGVE